MPIPSMTPERLEAAMVEFDNSLRASGAWQDWETKKNNLYAIHWQNRLYPVKQIVSMATGVEVGKFSGGDEANGAVAKLGFQIEALHLPSQPETQAALHELLLDRAPQTVTPQDASQVLATRFNLPSRLRTAAMPAGGRNFWEDRVQYARNTLVKTGRMDGSTEGVWSLADRSHPIVWLEKVLVAGRPDRAVGDYALGKALWSPRRNRAGDDEYWAMRDVQLGDYVVHLIDNEEIAGVSIAQGRASMDMVGLTNTAWEGVPSYLIRLASFEALDPPLHRAQFLGNPDLQHRLQDILRRHKNIFYNRKLDLNQGFYLTPMPRELVNLLDEAYQAAASLKLPLIDFSSIVDHPQGTRETVEEPQNTGFRPAQFQNLEPRVWLFAPGRQADHWDSFYEAGVAAMGWDDIGDLSKLDQAQITERLREAFGRENPSNDSLALYEFAHQMQEGDLLIAKLGRSRIVGYGTVVGPYQHDPTLETYRHIRRVRWDGRGEWATQSVLPLKTLTDITPYPELVSELRRLVGLEANDVTIAPAPVDELEPYTLEDALDGLFLDDDEFRRVLRIWRGKMNLIIQGPPGVGKTFIAKRLAYALMGVRDPSRLGMVQFHQSYSYEDFVQGYRPAGAGLILRDGLFVDFCRKASRDADTPHVFIIDEINRGNLSKVFGELMMLIESDKRGSGWSMPLAYAESSETQFYVPGNVYLLGLMNTADRSLAMVDYALRRRFAFWTATPQVSSEAFRRLLIDRGFDGPSASALQRTLAEMNAEIEADTTNLGPGFRIGHSYFCRERDSESTPAEWLADIIETEIGPLLDEYFVEAPSDAKPWRTRLLDLL